MNYTLSIIIPTYNRSSYLKLLLISILHGFNELPRDLELIILDNASSDSTKDMVADFISQYPSILYLNNETNIGMDGNIAKSFKVANGKFVWVIGDDEIMFKGTISYVLELCRNKNFGLIHLASLGISHDKQNISLNTLISNKPQTECVNSKQIFRLANIFLTFISANVVNRELILSLDPQFDSDSELGSYLPQLAWIYKSILICDNHLIVFTPMFGALGGNTSGYKLIKVFGENLTSITSKYFGKNDHTTTRIIQNAAITRVIANELFSQKNHHIFSNNFETENTKKALFSNFSGRIYFYLFLVPITSNISITRNISFFTLRIFNKINHRLRFILF